MMRVVFLLFLLAITMLVSCTAWNYRRHEAPAAPIPCPERRVVCMQV